MLLQTKSALDKGELQRYLQHGEHCGKLALCPTAYPHDVMDTDADAVVFEELNVGELLRCARTTVASDAADSSDDDNVARGFRCQLPHRR